MKIEVQVPPKRRYQPTRLHCVDPKDHNQNWQSFFRNYNQFLSLIELHYFQRERLKLGSFLTRLGFHGGNYGAMGCEAM
jgi:hypothetical protein